MTTKKYTPHIHAEVIKAWADGKPIESRLDWDEPWYYVQNPIWNPGQEYRVKPEEVVDFTVVLLDGRTGVTFTDTISNLEHYYSINHYQGYMKRTRIDGKVVSLEFISK